MIEGVSQLTRNPKINAKAISLCQQGMGKRPNKAQPRALKPEEESALWKKGQLGDFNGKVLTKQL